MLSDVAIDEFSNAENAKVEVVRQRLSEAGAGSSNEAIAEYYKSHPRELHADVVELGLNDQALPRFVRLKFPAGVVGLLVAALMAATMSSVDSGIHSITTALIVDFRDRLVPAWQPKTEAGEMLVARVMVVVSGAIAIVLACCVGQLGDVFAVAKKTVGAFAAPLLVIVTSFDSDYDGVFEEISLWPQMMWCVAVLMAVVGVGIYCLPSPRRPTDAARGAEHGASKGKLSGFRDSRGGRCGRAMVAAAAVDVAAAVDSRQTWKNYCAGGKTASKARCQAAVGAVEVSFWLFWYCWLPGDSRASTAVSYTHLTLPTILLV